MALGGLGENLFLPAEFKHSLLEQKIIGGQKCSVELGGEKKKSVLPLEPKSTFAGPTGLSSKEVLLDFSSAHRL